MVRTLAAVFTALLWVAFLPLAAAEAETRDAIPRASAATEQVRLTRHAALHVDATALMTAEEVAALARTGGMAHTGSARIPMFRVPKGEAWWLRYDVEADANAPRAWSMALGRPSMNFVQLYSQGADGRWTAHPRVGMGLPFSERPTPHRRFVYPVTLEPGRINSFLVRIDHEGAATPQATLWQPAALQAEDKAFFGIVSLYFGLAAGMVLYNLLLYVSIRDACYLMYAICAAFTAASFAASSGLGAQFAWGEHPY